MPDLVHDVLCRYNKHPSINVKPLIEIVPHATIRLKGLRMPCGGSSPGTWHPYVESVSGVDVGVIGV